MANSHRGEIAVRLGGRDFTLCLTLGALAEIEAAFGVDGLDALGARLAAGRLSARDLAAIVAAAARGGGHDVAASDIAALPVAGGLAPFVDAVTRLFAATFGDAVSAAGEGPPRPPPPRAP